MTGTRVRNRRGVAVVTTAAAITVALHPGAAHVGAGAPIATAQAHALPHRDSSPLLSRPEVQAELPTRLQHMRTRRAAQQARRVEEQRRRTAAHVGAATAGDVPRQPDPPMPPPRPAPE